MQQPYTGMIDNHDAVAADTAVTTTEATAHEPGEVEAGKAGLARVMSELARGLAAEPDLRATLTGITAAVVAAVPDAVHAGITRAQAHRVSAQAPTDAIVDKLDELQSELGEGPCIAALRQEHTIRIPDMAVEARWPEFARRAYGLGIAGMLSLQLFVEDDNLGALNLYATESGAFTTDDETIAEIFAAHAAIALRDAAEQHHLNQAIASRDMIGQAKGILMTRHGTTATRAFDLLVKASQRANMKLVDVARWLVEDHERALPAKPVPQVADGGDPRDPQGGR